MDGLAEAFKFLPLIGVFPALIAQKGGIFPPGNRIPQREQRRDADAASHQPDFLMGFLHLESLAQRCKDIQLVARAALGKPPRALPLYEKGKPHGFGFPVDGIDADGPSEQMLPRMGQADMGKLPGAEILQHIAVHFKRQRIGILCQRL